MRRISESIYPIDVTNQDAIDCGVNCDISYPAVQPGDIVRNALEYGVTADLKIGESCFDDDDDFTTVDPLSDVRTDWDDLSERQYIQNMTGVPTAEGAASAETKVEAPARPVPQPQAVDEGVA
jgi:hypothetical protein